MTRKRTARRVYALINPLVHAQYQASKLTVAEWNKQVTPVQASIDQLSRGEWDNDNWQPLFECLNRIESLLKLNRVKAADWIDDAQKAMVEALDRRANTGATAFKAGELTMIREVVSVYGDLLKEATHAQFAAACAHTNANISRVLANKHRMHEVAGCVFEKEFA